MIIMKKKLLIMFIIIFLSNILIGCVDFIKNIEQDPVLLKANPYIVNCCKCDTRLRSNTKKDKKAICYWCARKIQSENRRKNEITR